MTTESVEYILSAKDNASSVIRKSTADMELLNHEIQKSAKQSAASSDALQKFANVIGAGWIADGANQAKELAEGAKGAAEALKGGGKSALVMKAGLVGLVAYGSYTVGTMIADWVYQTKAAREEMEAMKAVFREQSATVIAVEARKNDLRKRNWELNQTNAAKEIDAQKQVLALNEEIYAREMSLSKLHGKEGDGTYVGIMKRVLEGKRQERDFYKNFNSAGEKEYRQNVERVEQQKNLEKEQLEGRKAMVKAYYDFQESMSKQFKAKHQQDLKEQAAAEKKKHDDAIKASADSVKALEKEISDLGGMKTDTSRPSLTSGDERMTSLARGGGDVQQQIAEHTKRQAAIAVRQEKLQVMMEKHLKLIAEKEEKVIEFAGAG